MQNRFVENCTGHIYSSKMLNSNSGGGGGLIQGSAIDGGNTVYRQYVENVDASELSLSQASFTSDQYTSLLP